MAYKNCEFKLDYSFEDDLLYLYNENKKSNGSIEFGDLIVDLEKKGEVVGLEIFDASKYLSELTSKKISKQNLKKIEKASFSFTSKKGTILIKIILPIKKEKSPATITIQNINYKSPLSAVH